MSSEPDLVRLIPAWLELTSQADVDLGLQPEEGYSRAAKLLSQLRSGQTTAAATTLDAEQAEALHALVAMVCSNPENNLESVIADIEVAYTHLSSLSWPADLLGGPSELLSRCAFQGWRVACALDSWNEMTRWETRVCNVSRDSEQLDRLRAAARFVRPDSLTDKTLRIPELLLVICHELRLKGETKPADVHDEAAALYALLQSSAEMDGTSAERHYFLGELALIAGTASRVAARFAEARQWFQRAEASLSLLECVEAHKARIAYQRLALALVELNIDVALAGAPKLLAEFRRLGMNEDALKCAFLEGAAVWERGDVRRAIEIHLDILNEAESRGNIRLVAMAAGNLARYFSEAGETETALYYAQTALPLIKRVENRVTFVKLQWVIADLLRKQGNLPAALEAYRSAQCSARSLGMRGELAEIHLVVAELLLEAGEEDRADQEIQAALPTIEEEKMVPQAIAALSLLRESLRRRQIDKQALRDLHGYFQEK